MAKFKATFSSLRNVRPEAYYNLIFSDVSFLQLVPRLQRLYGRIEEVDLYIGGTIERPLEGSLLGPTFQCIVGDQFRRLRLGDRFWYEEPNQVGSFTRGV